MTAWAIGLRAKEAIRNSGSTVQVAAKNGRQMPVPRHHELSMLLPTVDFQPVSKLAARIPKLSPDDPPVEDSERPE